MIEHRSEKIAGHVTDAAILSGREVVSMLTHGGNAIVAGGTVINDTGMIKHAGGKTADAVAHPAILGRGYVSRRFAYGERAVVAGRAIAGNTRVIEDRWKKCCC